MANEFEEVYFKEDGLITHDQMNKLMANDRYCYEKLQDTPNGIIQRWQTTSTIEINDGSSRYKTLPVITNMPFTVAANRYIGLFMSIGRTEFNSPSFAYCNLWTEAGFYVYIDDIRQTTWQVEKPFEQTDDFPHVGPFFTFITDRLEGGDHSMDVTAFANMTLSWYSTVNAKFVANPFWPIHLWIEDLGSAKIITSPEEIAIKFNHWGDLNPDAGWFL